MIPFGTPIVLDSCIVIHLCRDAETGKRIETQYHLSARRYDLFISSVTLAEVLAFATYQKWGQNRIRFLEELVSNLTMINAGDREVIDEYVELYGVMRKHGRTIQQNDLWIAATAKVMDAALLTTDNDFSWIDRKLIDIVIV